MSSRHRHRQTRQPVTADCPIQDGAGASIAEEGWARQLSASELQADLQPVDRQYQSTYRKGHSTEPALLEVLDGVFMAADEKQVTVR